MSEKTKMPKKILICVSKKILADVGTGIYRTTANAIKELVSNAFTDSPLCLRKSWFRQLRRGRLWQVAEGKCRRAGTNTHIIKGSIYLTSKPAKHLNSDPSNRYLSQIKTLCER